jgi:hypothetical protein
MSALEAVLSALGDLAARPNGVVVLVASTALVLALTVFWLVIKLVKK